VTTKAWTTTQVQGVAGDHPRRRPPAQRLSQPPGRSGSPTRTVTTAEGPLGAQWRVWAFVDGARLGVIPQDAAIVGRTSLAVPATFTVSPTETYADMHVVTA